ncbi:type II secretion system protein GspL [Thiomicrorhabdus sp.]|uniref:type II secretion system protein GspL n=1 Tax=Thiomicrorhabdus sp. TaxID=2039724 RepID=UPI00356592B5
MSQKHTEQKGMQVKQSHLPVFRQVRFDLSGKLLVETESGESQEAVLFIQAQEGKDNKDALKKVLAAVSVVWVPTEQVSLMQHFVPGKRRSDWIAALPYALEESLAEPVESLHFVALNRTPQGEVSVAVITKERMQLWVEQLRQIGLDHVLLVADCFRVPPTERMANTAANTMAQEPSSESQNGQVWSVYQQTDQRLLVRSGEYTGFAASPGWFEPLKQLHIQQHGEVLIETVEESALSNDCATSIAGVRHACKGFNLRSGEFQSKSKSGGQWKIWQSAGILLVALVAVYLLSLFMQAQQHRDQAAAYQAQTEKLFKQRFPEVKRIINIRTQAKTGFNQGSTTGDKVGPSQLVHQVEAVFAQFPKVQVVGLDWKASSGQLSLQIQSAQVNDLQSLAQAAGQKMLVELKVKNVSQTLAEGVLYVGAN